MKNSLIFVVVLWSCCLALVANVSRSASADDKKPAEAADKNAGFVSLYNGKNLDGWDVLDGNINCWQADGELLSCIKEGGGWLRTKDKYSDFVLKLEYRIPPDGNSGVGIRFPPKGNPAFDGMEIQILDDDAPMYKNLNVAQYTGSLYYQAAAKRGAIHKPGEWNRFEITCLGRHITVVLNGQKVVDADLDKYTHGEGGHSALADRPEYGYVGMQSHGTRVDFRNVALKDLMTTLPPG